MAKNKGKFGKGKSEVEQEDEFVSGVGKVFQALQPHAVKLGIVTGVVVIGVLAYSAWDWRQNQQLADATALFQRAVDTSEAPIVSEDVGESAGTEDLRFTTHEARSKATLEILDELNSKFGGSAVAEEARLLRAGTLLNLGKYDEAASLYRDYAQTGEPALRAWALEGVGYALEGKAAATEDAAARKSDLEAALKAFEDMAPGEDKPQRDVALYHQGRVLAVLDRKQEAIERYRKVLEVTDTELKLDVEERLTELGADEE